MGRCRKEEPASAERNGGVFFFFFFNHGKLDCWGKRCQSTEVQEWAEFAFAACLPSPASHGLRRSQRLCSWTWVSVGREIQYRLERAVLTPYQKPELHRGWSCSGSGGCPHRAGCGRHQSGQPHGHQNRWHLGSKQPTRNFLYPLLNSLSKH